MLEPRLNKIASVVNSFLGDEIVAMSDVVEVAARAGTMAQPPLDEDELEAVVNEILRRRIVIFENPDSGVVSKKHVKWLNDEKKNINWQRWDAYKALLLDQKGIPPHVATAMGDRASDLLDLAGNPNVPGSWDRRGLVIGDVQSGKTANYLALFNKAADAGYKVFILLAGGTNKLRQQTQTRVDEGFVGIDTNTLRLGPGGAGQLVQKRIGIGVLDSGIKTNSQTNFKSDFSSSQSASVVHLDAVVPTVFVIKKNKTVLKNLADWLATSAGQSQKISLPMMLLDDEADYASVNTNPKGDDATAINKGIRRLLDSFERSSYVGFTATPFANVLIDDDEVGDLFPKDFIKCLESPSNYFGPRRMLQGEEGPNSFIVPIEDAESFIPITHPSRLRVHGLPESLIDSIRVFYLTNAIRDLRVAQEPLPRSMMINVSRFKRVQGDVFELVRAVSGAISDAINYQRPSSPGEWARLELLFREQFEEIPETWEEVKNVLPNAVDGIQVKLVNSSNSLDDWDKVYASERARVIAVGGDVLSRGLTLEGLSTSYFYRKSLAYDTLMQMGRWFGYRDGYADLCRLWIDETVASWYQDIADALDELRADLGEMASMGLEPNNFGLAVRCHPSAMLTVTARNKSRAAKLSPKEINVTDIDIETPRLNPNGEAVTGNWSALGQMLSEMTAGKTTRIALDDKGRTIWTSVDQSIVGRFLGSYTPAQEDIMFGEEKGDDGNSAGVLADFISSNTAEDLKLWDVVIMSGSGGPAPDPFPGLSLVTRTIRHHPNSPSLYVGGSNQRLGATSDLGIPMSNKDRAVVKSKGVDGKAPASHEYRRLLKRPVLLVYPIEAKPAEHSSDLSSNWLPYVHRPGLPPLVGVHVAFPKKVSKENSLPKIKYMVNNVWRKIEQISLVPVADTDANEVDDDK